MSRSNGDEPGDAREVHFLNRLIRCGIQNNGESAIWIEPDRRHVDLLIQSLGLEHAKGTETSDLKKSVDQQMLEARSPSITKRAAVAIPLSGDASSLPVAGPP